MAKVFVGPGWVETSDGTLGGALDGRLSGRERALFLRLAQDRGQPVTFEDLQRAVWGDGRSDARRVKVVVQRLRTKIEPDRAQPTYVLTVLRQGYRLAHDEIVDRQEPSPDPITAASIDAEPPRVVDLPTLFGRAEEQALLEEWILRRHGRWLTLTGVGGVGKSALLEWAYARARAADLPCYLVALRDVQATDSALERIARAGRIPLPPHVEPEAVLAAALRGRDGLWLLDDLAGLEDEARSVIDRLFAPLPRVRVLATSRQPVQSLDEAVLPISPLDLESATAMYRSLAPEAAPPAPERLPVLPLWVKLTARAGEMDGPQPTETALIQAAFKRAEAPDALALLGWHPGETHCEILSYLLDISLDELESWRRTGLIEIHAQGRASVHPVIRDALRARSARTDRMGLGRRRQLERLVDYVRNHAATTFRDRPRAIRRELLDYLDLLLGWVRSLRPNQVEAVFEVLPMLVRIVIGSGHERAWVEALSELAERLDRRNEGRLAARLRLANVDISDRLSPAAQKLCDLLEIRRSDLEPHDQDLLDLHRAIAHLIVGEDATAQQILHRFEGRGDALTPALQVRYQLARSSMLRRLGRYDEAVALAREAVTQVRTAAPTLETRALLGLTSALQDGGFSREAWSVLDAFEHAAVRWDDHAALADCLRQRAQQASLNHQAGRALEHAEQALALEYPGSSAYAYALHTAAVLNRQNGAWARSLALLDEALEEVQTQRIPTLKPLLQDSKGNTLLRQGDVTGALHNYQQALQSALALGDDREAKRIHSNVAYAHFLAGDRAAALKHQELGRDHEAMHVGWKAYWEWRQAAIRFENGEPEVAARSLERAIEHALEMQSVDLACQAAALVASWLFTRGRPELAIAIGEAVALPPDSEHLVRRLPQTLRDAVLRPAAPELAPIVARVRAALSDLALTQPPRDTQVSNA